MSRGFFWFSVPSFNYIFKDYVAGISNSFLEARYWILNLALQNSAIEWCYRLDEGYFKFGCLSNRLNQVHKAPTSNPGVSSIP
jgi:hypothetical protein